MKTPTMKNLPIVKQVRSCFNHRRRLFFEYGMVGAIISLGAVCLTLWLYKEDVETELDGVNSRLNAVEQQRVQDAKTIDTILNDFQEMSRYNTEVKRRLENLEKTNKTVRQYLNGNYNFTFDCYLNSACRMPANSEAQRMPENSGES